MIIYDGLHPSILKTMLLKTLGSLLIPFKITRVSLILWQLQQPCENQNQTLLRTTIRELWIGTMKQVTKWLNSIMTDNENHLLLKTPDVAKFRKELNALRVYNRLPYLIYTRGSLYNPIQTCELLVTHTKFQLLHQESPLKLLIIIQTNNNSTLKNVQILLSEILSLNLRSLPQMFLHQAALNHSFHI